MKDNSDSSDPAKQTLNYCVCGEVLDKDQDFCGRNECVKLHKDISESIIKFFAFIEDGQKEEAFIYFTSLNHGVQAGILCQIEDSLFLDYIQMLPSNTVAKLIHIGGDLLRLRFLTFVEPILAQELESEFKIKSQLEKEALWDFFINLINLVLLLHQKKE